MNALLGSARDRAQSEAQRESHMSERPVQQLPAAKKTGSNDAKRYGSSLMKARDRLAANRAALEASGSPRLCSYPNSAAAEKAEREMASASTKAALRPRTKLRTAYEPDMVPSPGKRHLVQDIPPAELITGNRIASMDTFNQQIVPHLQCPACCQVGQLVARAEDEISSGFAGTVAPAGPQPCDVPAARSGHINFCDVI